MNLKKIIISTLGLACAGATGYFIGSRKNNKEITYAGTLWVDDSIPHKTPDMYLELDKDVEEVTKAKVVHLKVVKR